jgi:mycofactocin precursor
MADSTTRIISSGEAPVSDQPLDAENPLEEGEEGFEEDEIEEELINEDFTIDGICGVY